MFNNNLCIIPARGGSKRIPRKNIRNFLGKPIIAYSIEAALKSNSFSKVMVSTDDDEIMQIAKSFGAEVPVLRSKKNANDFATLSDVIEEVKDIYLDKNTRFENICCLLPTAPLISPELLQRGLKFLIETDADSVKPIVPYSYPIQRSLKLDVNGQVSYMHPQFSRTRSQDLETSYFDAGMFYWMNFDKGLIGNNKFAFVIDEFAAQDIDTNEDWIMAELKYQLLYGKIQ
ncbi:pseudaminic acid cytidylyltransferase [Dokdonia sp. PRO95]|uniref:pseudaminic acid cytidylyltransferase n=1 Tax=Dokdonia sp. PRO95 TaxID=1239415 RepID=UPI0005542BE9|nr:pseudaminic acid cytidylyltransferase [Dokdonia sp. PRO95]